MTRAPRTSGPTWARVTVVAALLGFATVLALLLLHRAVTTAHALGTRGALPATPDQVLAGLAAAAAGLLLLWLVVGAIVSALALVPGAVGRGAQRAAVHLTPLVVRAIVTALLGGVAAAGVAAPGPADLEPPARAAAALIVSAAPSSTGRLPEPGWPAGELPQPGWTPERPAAPTTPPSQVGLVSTAPGTEQDGDEHLVVHRGDTLWAIAARHLGPRASAGEIARAWPRWYAANRDVIGPDPDRLRPGQLLKPPPVQGDRP